MILAATIIFTATLYSTWTGIAAWALCSAAFFLAEHQPEEATAR